MRERAWLGGSAFAALVGAHALAYLFAAPDHHDRADLLHATGHGDWSNLFVFAGAALLASLVALGNRWASPTDRAVPTGRLLTHAWRRLLPLQVFGFIGLECAERALSGGSALAALGEIPVVLGIVLQIAAALVCAGLLAAFTRLVRRLRGTTAPKHVPVRTIHGSPRSPVFPRSIARSAWNLRGPPALLRSH